MWTEKEIFKYINMYIRKYVWSIDSALYIMYIHTQLNTQMHKYIHEYGYMRMCTCANKCIHKNRRVYQLCGDKNNLCFSERKTALLSANTY